MCVLTISDTFINGVLSFIGTILGLLLMYWLKPRLDISLNRKTKSFGVIYEKKFIVYNEIYKKIIFTRNYILNYHEPNSDIKKLVVELTEFIHENRLIIDENTFKIMYNDIVIYFQEYSGTRMYTPNSETKFKKHLDYERYFLGNTFEISIEKLYTIMKKDLDINNHS